MAGLAVRDAPVRALEEDRHGRDYGDGPGEQALGGAIPDTRVEDDL